MPRLIVTAVGIGWMCAAISSVIGAQPNERRREFLEGVLRVLVETQVLPDAARDSQPPPGKPPAPRPPADPRYRESRAAVEEFATQAGELVARLGQEERARPELRPLLADAMGVKAMTDALLRRTEADPDLTRMADGFSSVDQHWRTLATRLAGSFAVSAACRQSVHKLSECGSRVCQRLGIRPQVDQEELVRLLAELAGHLRGLQDEIAGVSQRSRNNQALSLEGQRLQMQVNLLIASANRRGSYDECLRQYQSLHKSWLEWADRLRTLEVRDADRHVRRITHVHRQLHDVLWIPLDLDRAGLTRDAMLLSSSVDTACEHISLNMLLAMRDAASVVETARELQSLCQDFHRAAAGQDSLDSLRWDFRPLDVQWQQFGACFRDPISPELTQQLALVEENIQSVQERLGIAPLLDFEQAVELAGLVDSLAELLYRDVAERVGSGPAYTARFRRDATAAAEAVHEAAHRLQDDLQHHPRAESVRKSSEILSAAWQTLQDYVGKLDHRDRVIVTRNYERLAPAMARLQMMFVY